MKAELLDEIEKLQYIDYDFVYLIRCGDSSFYKIGKAHNVQKRRDMLQVGNPYYLKVVAVLRTCDPQRLEKQMHKMFKAKRMYGEWFNFTDEDIEMFCRQPNSTVFQ